MSRIHTARDRLQRLAGTTAMAWRQDKPFRYAVIGMGVSLALLLTRPSISHRHREPVLPPLNTASTGTLALPNPAGGIAAPAGRDPVGPVPRIAPGQPLSDVTVAPATDGDRFGTVTPGHHHP